AQTACGSATALFGFEPMDAQDSARAANSRVVFIRSERSVSRSVPARGRGRRFGYEWVSFHRRILERRLSRVRARSASTGSMERTDEPVAGCESAPRRGSSDAVGPKQREKALRSALRSYLSKESKPSRDSNEHHPLPRPRICLALFEAAEALGIGFVRGAKPYIYVERLNGDVLKDLVLSESAEEQDADIYARRPATRERAFR